MNYRLAIITLALLAGCCKPDPQRAEQLQALFFKCLEKAPGAVIHCEIVAHRMLP